MKKITSLLTVFAICTLSIFTLFQGCSKGPSEEELNRISELEEALQVKEAEAAKSAQRTTALEEAKRMAEEATAKAGEAEAARLRELAAQVEREKADKARLTNMVNDLNTKSEAASQQQKSLQAELEKTKMERENAAAQAAAKVAAAERQLAESQSNKAAEIAAAREEALSEAIARMEQRADKGGYTPATAVASDRKRESISSFLEVEISERNFRNNTRRTAQRREGE